MSPYGATAGRETADERPDGRDQVRQLLDREGSHFWRACYDAIEALARLEARGTPAPLISTELRQGSISIRERRSGAALLVAAVDDPQQPRLQMRTFAPCAKGCLDFDFSVTADGRLAVGARGALDPAGVARRAVDLLLAIARPREGVNRSETGTGESDGDRHASGV